MHGIIAERDVTDHRVEEIIGKSRFLEALCEDGGIGIELLGDAGGDAVHFYAGTPGARQQHFRHQPEEMTGTH